MAEEELMREAKRGEARAAVYGVMGWLQDKTPRTNKRFLSNTISNALQHNHRQCNSGTLREEPHSHHNKEKSHKRERADSHSAKKLEDKKLKHKSKHKRSKSKCNQDSDSDKSSDKRKSKYHQPKLKRQKLH